MDWRERILSDPAILRGKPCLRGTRIPAALVLGYLAAGRETDAILKEFPAPPRPTSSRASSTPVNWPISRPWRREPQDLLRSLRAGGNHRLAPGGRPPGH
ncbi:MAG: DUF433 domain-containing protein [Limisphaerales bacterium]